MITKRIVKGDSAKKYMIPRTDNGFFETITSGMLAMLANILTIMINKSRKKDVKSRKKDVKFIAQIVSSANSCAQVFQF